MASLNIEKTVILTLNPTEAGVIKALLGKTNSTGSEKLSNICENLYSLLDNNDIDSVGLIKCSQTGSISIHDIIQK